MGFRAFLTLSCRILLTSALAAASMRAFQNSQNSGGDQDSKGAQGKAPSSADQSSSSTKQSPKILILYKSSATESDRERVRTLLNAKVSARFHDPEMEEVTVTVPPGAESVGFVKAALKKAKDDKAVQSAQIRSSYTYELK